MSPPVRIRQIDGAFYAHAKTGAPVRVARVVAECACQGVGTDCTTCRGGGLATAWIPAARLREARAC